MVAGRVLEGALGLGIELESTLGQEAGPCRERDGAVSKSQGKSMQALCSGQPSEASIACHILALQ